MKEATQTRTERRRAPDFAELVVATRRRHVANLRREAAARCAVALGYVALATGFALIVLVASSSHG